MVSAFPVCSLKTRKYNGVASVILVRNTKRFGRTMRLILKVSTFKFIKKIIREVTLFLKS